MASPPTEPDSGAVLLTIALPAEARSLISRYGLSPRGDGRPFRTWVSEDRRLILVICGVGKTAACAATKHVCDADRVVACLNVGIAGHARRPLGQLVLAHRVDDAVDGRVWFPPLVFEPPCPTATVRTVAAACADYPDDALVEMEAAGFLDAAVPCVGRELAHVAKVVSDNRERPAPTLGGKGVEGLIGGNLPLIERIIEELGVLGGAREKRRAEPAGLAEILAYAHFSATRRRQLRRQLRRWASLSPGDDPAAWVTANCGQDAGAVVDALRGRLDAIAPVLPADR